MHDLTLLRNSDLLHRIEKSDGVMLDKGYDGLQTFDPKQPDKNGPPHPYHLPHKARRGHPLTEEQKPFNAHLSKYRTRHSGLTRIVAGLVNRRIAKRPLKTYPTA